MSVSIRWKSPGGEGAFTLRGAPLHLVWTGAEFDRISRPVGEEDGLRLDPPDAQGRVGVEVSGTLVLRTGGKSFRKGRVPAGCILGFEVDGESGRLEIEGSKDELAGREFGGYRILARLGAGAVGRVYRALQVNLQREVALKVLDPRIASDPDKVESFRREAMAAGKLSHPNLVQVYDVGEADGLYFFSMELMPEGSLEDRLKEEGPLPWREAVEAVRDCAQALDFANENHIIHRDVKPENLMVAPAGMVKLADLGLAATRGMIVKEAAGGTPHFMAPEAIGKAPIDHRVDLYSLGCTLHRLVTGGTPFQGETVRDILRAHRDQPPPTLRASGFPVPKQVEQLHAKLLAKNPDKRHASAGEVVDACDRVLSAGTSRTLVATLLLVLVSIAGWAGWQTFGKQAHETNGRETVIEFVTDPRASQLEAELAVREVELAFARARGSAAPAARITALEGFLRENPGASQAQEASGLIEAARLEIVAAAAAAENPGGDPSAALVRLTREVEDDLGAGRIAAALARVAGAGNLDPFERNALRARVFEEADRRLGLWREQHLRALGAGDWRVAATVREAAHAALLDPTTEGHEWASALADLSAAAEEAEAEERRAIFRDSRVGLLQVIQDESDPALREWDPARARDAYRDAVGRCGHASLKQAALALQPAFDAATRAVEGMRRGLDGGREIEVLSQDGKRGELVAFRSDGLELRVQVRGKRVLRTEPWSAYLQPERLAALISAAGGDGDVRDAGTLYLLLAASRVAETVRGWEGRLPDTAAAERTAAEIRAWLRFEPSAAKTADPLLDALREPLLDLAGFCEALAREDEYLALQRLEGFNGRYSLLSALLSDGSSGWGLEP